MGSSKAAPQRPYRDEPDFAETASMSSAVLLDDAEAFPDDELPAYQDIPSETPLISHDGPSGREVYFHGRYCAPPDLPFSSHDLAYQEFRTRFPNYSTNADDLYRMIKAQAQYSPTYFVQLYGTHTETRKNGNKETKDRITDFYIRINITYLLGEGKGEIELLPDNKRGYRGTRIVSLRPNVTEDYAEEGSDELLRWCRRYVDDKSKIKSFTLKRKVINHDTKRLEQLIRSAIAETDYRGHLSVEFPQQHTEVIVYSPGKINEWRITTWIRWVFYLSFLWIFSWPLLFFMTARYEVVNAVFKYADTPPGDDMRRKCQVMTEGEWYHRWELAIKRAALARMVNKETCLDENYRNATQANAGRGDTYDPQTPNPGNILGAAALLGQGMRIAQPTTSNGFGNGALGFLGQGLRVSGLLDQQRGWGYDT